MKVVNFVVFNTMAEGEVIYSYQGEMNNDILRSILKVLDDKMEELGEQRFFRKKVNSILIECLQNLMSHAEKASSDTTMPSLLIKKEENGYEIQTTNLTNEEKASFLKKHLDKINSMGSEELKDFYQEILTNGQFNPEGGAGLGFINIARKTKDNRVKYDFLEKGNKQLFFNLSITV